MPLAPGDDLLVAVEAHLLAVLGADSGRASVSFVGVDRVDVLRFGPDPEGCVRYATLGMSRRAMGAAATPSGVLVAAETGPRAELLLAVRGARDTVLRRLAVLAALPAVEGVVVAPGATLELGEPLWDGSACSAVLVGEPGAGPVGGDRALAVPDLALDLPAEPVRFLPLVPVTPEELAWKRVHGPLALRELWADRGTDLLDPHRRGVRLP